MTSLQLVQAGSSAVNVYSYHTGPMSAGVLFLCFGLPVHSLTQSVEIKSCQLNVSVIFQHFHRKWGKKVLQVSLPSALHNTHELSIENRFIIIYTLSLA